MIRVGFIHPAYGDRWLGGINYLRNLFAALSAAPELGVVPVLLGAPRAPIRPELAGVEVVRGHAILARHLLESRGLEWLATSYPPLEWTLRRADLRVLSHSGLLGRRSRIPTIAWIPDLQHRALPSFFSAGERATRDAQIAADLDRAARVVLSSEAARSDLVRWFPGHEGKLRVVRFVHRPPPLAELPALEALEARHGLRGPFLLLPNQYWAHKNHGVVLEALAVLASRGHDLQVISTGATSDYRDPGHFDRLMRRRAELGLEDRYRVLGVVPYAELAALLRHAAAVINPSLFEGWSTTVEESKSMGKRLVLSDLPVHREQAPERATFFDPRDPAALADALLDAAASFDPAADRAAAAQAAAALPVRQRAFACAYAGVVGELAPGGARGAVAHPPTCPPR